MVSEVHYCTTDDGVRIAYAVEGTGPPVLFSHQTYSFSLAHTVPKLHEAIAEIGRGYRLIRFDMRGTGLSQRAVEDVSPSALVRDMEAVVNALSIRSFALIGAAVGGMRAIQYAAEHPDQVSCLALYETFARVSEVLPVNVVQAVAQLSRANWRLATRAIVDAGVRRTDEDEGLLWAELFEKSLDGETNARILEAHAHHDVSHLLPAIQCPTLVCHSRNDRLFAFSQGQSMAEAIPRATLVPLETETDGPFTHPQEAVAAIRSFLAEQHSRIEAQPGRQTASRPLTPRELAILRLIAAGRTSSEISAELSLSTRTVSRHITNIYNKIDARGRADATAYALRQGIVFE